MAVESFGKRVVYRDPVNGQFVTKQLYEKIVRWDEDQAIILRERERRADQRQYEYDRQAERERQEREELSDFLDEFDESDVPYLIDTWITELSSMISSQLDSLIGSKLNDKLSIFNKFGDKKAFLKLNEEMAKGARNAVIQSYEQSTIGDGPSYRWNDTGVNKRYSKGAMERAFKDPGFITYDSQYIQFGVRAVLDRHAKQWYRLNFGASPATTPKSRFKVNFGDLDTSGLDLSSFGPSRPFKIPQRGRGIWASKAFASTLGQSLPSAGRAEGVAFYPLLIDSQKDSGQKISIGPKAAESLKNRKITSGSRTGISSIRKPFVSSAPTKGIKGTRFLEAGTNYINKNYPKALNLLIKSWID